MQCFDKVSAVIYITALDEYNRTLLEDNDTNRLEESLSLFSEVTSSEYLIDKDIILFLNKSDIFEEKIKQEPLSDTFTDIDEDEGDDFELGVIYIENLYRSSYKGHGAIHTFTTCVLESSNVEKIFKAMLDLINESAHQFAL
eukprot:TRINITY_DN1751_c0_g1_i1.p1 TRINITY_DN1751_c0_g1~~TRINITY_DN1751_c0_g1_i1.p1  ORF type:complete len:142 (-),score=22.59 TRINITY_DN1751_c0_g1_i1:29-454(-)